MLTILKYCVVQTTQQHMRASRASHVLARFSSFFFVASCPNCLVCNFFHALNHFISTNILWDILFIWGLLELILVSCYLDLLVLVILPGLAPRFEIQFQNPGTQIKQRVPYQTKNVFIVPVKSSDISYIPCNLYNFSLCYKVIVTNGVMGMASKFRAPFCKTWMMDRNTCNTLDSSN